MWQELYDELGPRGLEIVTVAMDSGGAEAAEPWIAVAHTRHPSLVDRSHRMGELFGVVNVPSGIWINEAGTIVRPPETAYPRRPDFLDGVIPADATPEDLRGIEAVRKLQINAEGYIAALRDWVENGAESRYALPSEEVVRRSRPRPVEAATAAAHFELGQHLHATGYVETAVEHFRRAYQLQPENWTYKRQAWNLLAPGQTSLEVYGGNWLADVEKIGAENYYPKVEL